MLVDYSKYMREAKFPHIWCAGCGHGIVMKSIIRAIDKTGIEKDDIVMVSGIGCSSRTPGYLDFNTLHTTHGRAIAFATGVKMAKPQLNVIVVTGDGDATAIGGNHFIHAARRNIDLTVIVFNNYIYGMTGGQGSPTTPYGKFASTFPYGNIDPNFNIPMLAEAAGASFVARGTSHGARALDKMIEKGIIKKGFALIEAFSACPTSYGRRNRLGDGADMLRWQKDNSVSLKAASRMSAVELQGKIITGVLVDRDFPEYTEEYEKLKKKALLK